ncbi:hypothetical protein BOTBODRAFT_189428 [Botryobasidium botryosum FD-172 SS1]|uniref:Aquaporin n=1 Tax=Botryobasidium botryosum (strain FD-172 SS1) TaxID=930990 RepID=A0A067MBT3_BOTB1|nr:hypothetical protein BOTBODRAFT_189428 [Botryobasidium botryosum FD-172 SS1]
MDDHGDFAPKGTHRQYSSHQHHHDHGESVLAQRHVSEEVLSRPFAGRLGGNQAFTLSKDDPDYDEKRRSTPDAATSLSWRESFDLRAFRDGELWTQAVFEGWATSMLVWTSGLLGLTFSSATPDFASGPLFPTLLGALGNTISLMLFIFTAGPVSGGHLNPLITIGTFCARLATFPRTVLYVLFQLTGATIAAFLIRATLGDRIPGVVPGCYIDPSLVSPGEAVILETMSCLTLLFLACGLGLDPRQRTVYSPALPPVLIGLALGLCTLATGAVKPGYTGAAMNPARCFGFMAAERRWDLHWVHWVGVFIAGVVNGVFYWAIPPSRKRKML